MKMEFHKEYLDLILVPSGLLIMFTYHLFLPYKYVNQPHTTVIGFENNDKRIWIERIMQELGLPIHPKLSSRVNRSMGTLNQPPFQIKFLRIRNEFPLVTSRAIKNISILCLKNGRKPSLLTRDGHSYGHDGMVSSINTIQDFGSGASMGTLGNMLCSGIRKRRMVARLPTPDKPRPTEATSSIFRLSSDVGPRG
ncbi:hypothetical protein VNO77_04029 [Canavalia gladiata]|uniref:Uncharacterized protein n=1 Tax=Canavalia gladiata TaxID=3824 RepID=A0AAN9MVX6_CANGL